MRLLKILMCVLMVCLLTVTGYSQTIQDKNARAKADELSKLVFGDDVALIRALIGGTRTVLKGIFDQNPQTRPYSEVLGEALAEVMEAAYSDPETIKQFRDIQIELLMDTYTINEIQELINFYNTPIGKKTIKVMPDITKKSMERGAVIGQNVGNSPKVKEMMDNKIARLKKEGKLPPDF